MRRFSAEYLADTRRGLWADRTALAALSLSDRRRVVDVGCGTGALTRVLREETPPDATVLGVDVDRRLLAEVPPPTALGAATRLPLRDDTVDLATCQALLVNLPEPLAAVRELARVSGDLVAVVEPDNGAVAVDSTVTAESGLAATARAAYVEGVDTDVALGGDAAALLRAADLEVVETSVRHHARTVTPPYDEAALEGARRKVRAAALREAREELLAGGLSEAEYEALVADWQAMGRAAVEQMDAGRYRRAEVVPFHVVVGRVPGADEPGDG